MDILSQTFSALSDPTRRAIVEQLARGEATVTELSQPFNLSQPAISKHIKILENAGLISRSRVAQRRPCHLEIETLNQAVKWIETYITLWDTSFDQMESYLHALQSSSQKDAKNDNT
ncbi:MAG: metalloregulator ArsR/SmtB family transcription factor [Alphaproteobacteria bacterium]|nr:metalloregulator ArsR/SmtB family transcription factor [Alphaproteobacteria bacterium]